MSENFLKKPILSTGFIHRKIGFKYSLKIVLISLGFYDVL
jgi:hypothetical protein